MINQKPAYSSPVFAAPTDLSQAPNELIKEIYSKGYVRDKEGKQTSNLLKSSIPFDQGMALYQWIRQTEASRTLEIGMAYGLSTLFMCQAHLDNRKQGHHLAIDPKQSKNYRSIGLLNIQRANLDEQLEFFEAPSYCILPQLLQRNERFDLIFIDGMHTFDYTLVDFFYSDLLLKVGGYIIFDDIWMPSVRKILMYVLRNRSYRLEPKLLWNPQPGWRSAWNFFTQSGRKQRLSLNAQQFIQNPVDFSTFFSLAYFGLRSGLKYYGVQKITEDDRQWHHHIAF
jgi:predicted O-methyltransferase YrrM